MPMPFYDSRDPGCKTPFGAVATGQTITLSIHLPKIHLSDPPILKLFEMDFWEDPLVIPMVFTGGDRLQNHYTCTFVPEKPCLYAYFFEIFSEGRLQALKRGEDGGGVLGDHHGHLWQLTVYDAAMECPSFLREGVLYQIFPDRFYRSGTAHDGIPADRTQRDDWGAIPTWRPNEQGIMTNSDYFLGDLAGIEQKLDYLGELGVTAIYLNPIFEAHANHRYNTADYTRVDPALGTGEDSERLCAAAGKRGISVILDGVFSHTGSDSVYFNKERRYGDGGAYNDPASPYRDWYRFTDYPRSYDSWWGFDTLPNINETHPGYLEFICGENGVLHSWLDKVAAGFRLDVADELPDEFLDALHDSVKGHSPDACIIGEVWEDASNKESYGVRRRYLLGGQLDSVMNYPFKDAVLNYIRWGNYHIFYDVLMQILENYPRPAIQALMNSLSTHDTVRAITSLVGPLLEQHDREWQERNHYLPAEQYAHCRRLFMLASVLQFGLPGIPCVYYGDEAGLTGYRDPFNRVCYPWGNEDQELVAFIRSLGRVRTNHQIFAEAEFLPVTFSRDLCSFVRAGVSKAILFAVNRSQGDHKLSLPPGFEQPEILTLCGEYQNGLLGAYSGIVLLGSAL